MPPKRPPPPKEKTAKTIKTTAAGGGAGAVAAEGVSSTRNKENAEMQDLMDKIVDELNRSSSSDDDSIIEAADGQFTNGTTNELSEAEQELIKEELKKTEEEINTLRQVLVARQKHAADLKRKLGISPLTELTADINQSLQHVKESQAYQKTSEVVAGTADTVKSKWNDMRNSSLFKSFESKLGTAYTNAKMAASTSIDQLSGIARSGSSSQADPASPSSEKVPLK